MITLEHDSLNIRFPQIHPDAVCTIEFQRTLRIPDDNRTHALPPGLGKFPLLHVDDHASKLPAAWQNRGGVFLPMHQAEAMWVRFHSRYPFAVKIAAGKINAVTGKPWTPELKGPRSERFPGGAQASGGLVDGGYYNGIPRNPPLFGGHTVFGPDSFPAGPTPPFCPAYPVFGPAPFDNPAYRERSANTDEDQDYLSVPKQPWLDGFCVEKGKIRQFVAMPMGDGYTVEEQITGDAVHGGLQIIIYPLKPEFYLPPRQKSALRSLNMLSGGVAYGMCASGSSAISGAVGSMASAQSDMGMAPGGLMEQKIHVDSFGIDKFDQTVSAKCFVHLLNSQQYERATGKKPPQATPSAADYTKQGLPFFKEWDNGSQALPGAAPLKKLDSVANLGNKLGKNPLPENGQAPCLPQIIVVKNPNQVREGKF